jgi:hypothetical protein
VWRALAPLLEACAHALRPPSSFAHDIAQGAGQASSHQAEPEARLPPQVRVHAARPPHARRHSTGAQHVTDNTHMAIAENPCTDDFTRSPHPKRNTKQMFAHGRWRRVGSRTPPFFRALARSRPLHWSTPCAPGWRWPPAPTRPRRPPDADRPPLTQTQQRRARATSPPGALGSAATAATRTRAARTARSWR